jgi:O-antigen ligase
MVAIERSVKEWDEAASPPRSRTFGITAEGVIFALFIAGLAWVPYWLGSNRLIAWGINAILFAGLASLYEFSLLIRGAAHPVPIKRIRLVAILFALVIVWIVLQNAPWMPTTWQHPIWQLTSDVLSWPVAGSISVDRDLTALALLRLVTAAGTFWLALQLCRNTTRARLLIWSVIGISACYAAVGLFALGFMPNGRLFSEFGAIKFITSTFVNQNNYATFAGIGLIAAVAAILRVYRRAFAQTGDLLRLQIATLISTTGSKGALPLALAAVILAALLLTGSRGGIISAMCGVLVLFTLNIGRTRRPGWNEVLLVIFASLLVAIAFAGFGDVLVGRITAQGLYDPGRPAVLTVTLRSILSAPLLGFGYGTFSTAFPMFRDDSIGISLVWDKAHDTYLEIFQGLGLLFGAALIACVVILVWECVKGARTRRRDATIPAIAASVSVLVGLNGFVDFSLQIQAVTLTYMAVLGAGVAQAWEDDLLKGRKSANPISRLSKWSEEETR